MLDLRAALCNCLSPHHEVRVPAESRLLELSCERGYALHLMHLIVSEVSTSIALQTFSHVLGDAPEYTRTCWIVNCVYYSTCMCDRTYVFVTGKKARQRSLNFPLSLDRDDGICRYLSFPASSCGSKDAVQSLLSTSCGFFVAAALMLRPLASHSLAARRCLTQWARLVQGRRFERAACGEHHAQKPCDEEMVSF